MRKTDIMTSMGTRDMTNMYIHPHHHVQLKKLNIFHTHTYTQSIKNFYFKMEMSSDETHGCMFIFRP